MFDHPQEIKLTFIRELQKRIPAESIQAINNFQIISSQNVYDPSNKIYVFDLLYIVEDLCRKYEDCSDIIKVLVEQLEDMSTGLCPQGRTTRLYQIVFSFMEDVFED
jgi:methyltransferase-like protein